MAVLGVLFIALKVVCQVWTFLIIFRIILTWTSSYPGGPAQVFLIRSTEPALAPIRRLLYRIAGRTGNIDLSPLIAIIILQIIYAVLP